MASSSRNAKQIARSAESASTLKERKGVITLAYPRSGQHQVVMTRIYEFPWRFESVTTVDDNEEEHVGFQLTNEKSDEAMMWFADVSLSLRIRYEPDPNSSRVRVGQKSKIRIAHGSNSVQFSNFISKEDLRLAEDIWVNDVCTFELTIQHTGHSGNKFRKRSVIDWSEEGTGADCCLVVEGSSFYVGKHMLARHSSYFESMFFGSFKESKMETIPLQEMSKENFKLFLNWLHQCGEPVGASNVWGLLEIAHRLDVPRCVDEAERFLLTSNEISLNERLVLADQYGLHVLRAKSLDELDTLEKIELLKGSPYWGELHQSTTDFCVDKLIQLSKVAGTASAATAAAGPASILQNMSLQQQVQAYLQPQQANSQLHQQLQQHLQQHLQQQMQQHHLQQQMHQQHHQHQQQQLQMQQLQQLQQQSLAWHRHQQLPQPQLAPLPPGYAPMQAVAGGAVVGAVQAAAFLAPIQAGAVGGGPVAGGGPMQAAPPLAPIQAGAGGGGPVAGGRPVQAPAPARPAVALPVAPPANAPNRAPLLNPAPPAQNAPAPLNPPLLRNARKRPAPNDGSA